MKLMEAVQASFGHLLRENPMGQARKEALKPGRCVELPKIGLWKGGQRGRYTKYGGKKWILQTSILLFSRLIRLAC
jgi:hypothetical protein